MCVGSINLVERSANSSHRVSLARLTALCFVPINDQLLRVCRENSVERLLSQRSRRIAYKYTRFWFRNAREAVTILGHHNYLSLPGVQLSVTRSKLSRSLRRLLSPTGTELRCRVRTILCCPRLHSFVDLLGNVTLD